MQGFQVPDELLGGLMVCHIEDFPCFSSGRLCLAQLRASMSHIRHAPCTTSDTNYGKIKAINTRLWQTGEDKRTWSLHKALKCQDPSFIRGMVTVDKELPTHLNAGKSNIFGLPAGIMPSQEVTYSPYVGMSPCQSR